MEITDFVNLGLAGVIAMMVNRKMDAFILEFKKTSTIISAALSKLVVRQDSHEDRIVKIEEFLTQIEETPDETTVSGFTSK